MFFAAVLAITLAPVLMTLLIRGKISPEAKNPLNRFLISVYEPALNFVLRFRGFVLLVVLFILCPPIFPSARLGRVSLVEVIEGSLRGMPSAVTGMASAEALNIVQI